MSMNLSQTSLCVCVLQKSSSSESLSDKGSSDLKKSFDAVVFDVLKVTPEEYAVSEAEAVCLTPMSRVFKNESYREHTSNVLT